MMIKYIARKNYYNGPILQESIDYWVPYITYHVDSYISAPPTYSFKNKDNPVVRLLIDSYICQFYPQEVAKVLAAKGYTMRVLKTSDESREPRLYEIEATKTKSLLTNKPTSY